MVFVFFNDTATTEIYTLSLHDALPIFTNVARHAGVDRAAVTFSLVGGTHLRVRVADAGTCERPWRHGVGLAAMRERRSEEHTSELQSRQYLVCRLLLEQKNRQPPALSD